MDTMLTLISTAGDYVSDEIWHRAVQIVTNNEDLQKYAAEKVYHALTPSVVHENMVKCGGYILGEYGYILNDEPENPVLVRALEALTIMPNEHFIHRTTLICFCRHKHNLTSCSATFVTPKQSPRSSKFCCTRLQR